MTSAPASVEEFQSRLLEVSTDLPKRMRQCAEYIAENTDRIPVSTVAELANGAGVQPSAMMRFCQILGFSGYSEMQKLFRNAYVPTLPDYETRLENLRQRGTGSPSALLAEFVDAGRLSLENLASSVDSDLLDKAVETLAQAGMIHVVGLRRAFPVAAYLVYAFEKMKIPAMFHGGTGKLDHQYAIRDGDAMIAITFAPYSHETVDIALGAVEAGRPVVAITDTTLSPMHVPGVLPLAVSEVDFGAFRALSATLSLAITLAVATGARKNAMK